MSDHLPPQINLNVVESGDELSFIKALFVEYADSFGYEICFDSFDRELQLLPHPYAHPEGALILARVNEEVAGCVAIKRHDGGTAEMKRLYVRDRFRGHMLGTHLVTAAMEAARDCGYRRLVLETIGERMGAAEGVYRSLGFRQCDPYYDAPLPEVRFYEADLSG